MPIYEYECNDCGHKLEVIQKLSDDLLKDCPDCGEASLRKLVSAAGFRLKGSGWYETDFKSSNKRNVAGSDSGNDTGNNSGDSKKTADSGKKAAAPASSGTGGSGAAVSK